MVLHETSGWPPRVNGRNMFRRAFLGGGGGLTTQLYVAGDGTVLQGMELPRRTAHAGFVNDRAIGSETGHPWGNYAGNFHLGPYSSSDHTMVPDPAHPGERSSGPPTARCARCTAGRAAAGCRCRATTRSPTPPTTTCPASSCGCRACPARSSSAGGPRPATPGPGARSSACPRRCSPKGSTGPGRCSRATSPSASLLPRNVPLLPHKTRVPGTGAAGNLHGMLREGASFAAIVLADEGLSRRPQTFGLPPAPAPPAAADVQARYVPRAPAGAAFNPRWDELFDTYRGFYGHGFAGDHINGDHDCPGPMFDWHRFARELWDWWWHPFDFDPAAPARAGRGAGVLARHPQRRHPAQGALLEHAGRRAGRPAGRGHPRAARLAAHLRAADRVAGLRDGGRRDRVRVVSARGAGVDLGLIVVRHEVFDRARASAAPRRRAVVPPGLRRRADLGLLAVHAPGPPRRDPLRPRRPGEPDWLNRMSCASRSASWASRSARRRRRRIAAATWNDGRPAAGGSSGPPSSRAGRSTRRTTARRCSASPSGVLTLFPGERLGTPVRVMLATSSADAGVIRRDAAGQRRGVRVEIFSHDVVLPRLHRDRDRRGAPLGPGRGAAGHPARGALPERVSRTPRRRSRPPRRERRGRPDLTHWWRRCSSDDVRRTGGRRATGRRRLAVDYDPYEFLPWLNARTWQRAAEVPRRQPAGVPAIRSDPDGVSKSSARPQTRRRYGRRLHAIWEVPVPVRRPCASSSSARLPVAVRQAAPTTPSPARDRRLRCAGARAAPLAVALRRCSSWPSLARCSFPRWRDGGARGLVLLLVFCAVIVRRSRAARRWTALLGGLTQTEVGRGRLSATSRWRGGRVRRVRHRRGRGRAPAGSGGLPIVTTAWR